MDEPEFGQAEYMPPLLEVNLDVNSLMSTHVNYAPAGPFRRHGQDSFLAPAPATDFEEDAVMAASQQEIGYASNELGTFLDLGLPPSLFPSLPPSAPPHAPQAVRDSIADEAPARAASIAHAPQAPAAPEQGSAARSLPKQPFGGPQSSTRGIAQGVAAVRPQASMIVRREMSAHVVAARTSTPSAPVPAPASATTSRAPASVAPAVAPTTAAAFSFTQLASILPSVAPTAATPAAAGAAAGGAGVPSRLVSADRATALLDALLTLQSALGAESSRRA